jgi:hypothetical protein
MLILSDDFDWKNSEAHALLLSKFIEPNFSSILDNSQEWEKILKEKPAKAIQRLNLQGYLIERNLGTEKDETIIQQSQKLEHWGNGKIISGRKPDLQNELSNPTSDFLEGLGAGSRVYHCSTKGLLFAKNYLQKKEIEKEEVEKILINLLQQNLFDKSSDLVTEYDARQLFPKRNVGNGTNNKYKQDLEVLTLISTSHPKILKEISTNELDDIRLAASMMYLWDTHTGMKWIPAQFKLSTRIGVDTAIRMLCSYSVNHFKLSEFQPGKDGIVWATISTKEECCSECNMLSGKIYQLKDAVEIPFERCTNIMGCECSYSPLPVTNLF